MKKGRAKALSFLTPSKKPNNLFLPLTWSTATLHQSYRNIFIDLQSPRTILWLKRLTPPEGSLWHWRSGSIMSWITLELRALMPQAQELSCLILMAAGRQWKMFGKSALTDGKWKVSLRRCKKGVRSSSRAARPTLYRLLTSRKFHDWSPERVSLWK